MNATSGDGNDHPDNNLPNHFENERRRRGKGRKKVKIEKIEDKSSLQVSFSKRKAGILKKTSELCTLCGAEMAFLVFSPSGRPHCFGHPNFEAVTDRFLQAGGNAADGFSMPQDEAVEHQRNQALADMEEAFEREKQRGREIDGQEPAVQMDYLNPDTLQLVDDKVKEYNQLAINSASSSSAAATGAYGYGMAPGIGNTVQYQPTGVNGMAPNNYVDPSDVVMYDAGNKSSYEDEDEDEDEDDDDAPDGANDGGFPGNYGHPGY